MQIGKSGIATIVIYVVIFATSTVGMVFLDNYPSHNISVALKPMTNTVYAWHLGCWMVLGMAANYLWDHLRSGKQLQDVVLANLLLPLLVSPIVFFGIWSFIPKVDGSDLAKISLAWPFVAFQNGFFWQVVFSKAGPITNPG
jgi:hypothetical protein